MVVKYPITAPTPNAPNTTDNVLVVMNSASTASGLFNATNAIANTIKAAASLNKLSPSVKIFKRCGTLKLEKTEETVTGSVAANIQNNNVTAAIDNG